MRYQCYFMTMILMRLMSSIFYAYCAAFRFDLPYSDYYLYYVDDLPFQHLKFTAG